MSFTALQKNYSKIVDSALHLFLKDESIPQLLSESMAYSLFAGGKRLRPGLLLASCELLSGDINTAIPFACAIEMIHTYSLIHDDLPSMDNDDYRRGKLTNHKVYGEGQAILAGDGLLSYAFEIMSSELSMNNSLNLIKATKRISECIGVKGMVAGQCLDLYYEAKNVKDENVLEQIHSLKTSAMLQASIEAGAYCANATEEEIAALQCFGKAYGMLFQITDDILDLTGSKKEMGKTIGKDESSGKLTFPFVYGLEKSKELANIEYERAKSAISVFGEKADYFLSLLDFTISRAN